MAVVTGGRWRTRVSRAGLYALLTLIGVAMLFPFLFVVGSSFKARDDIFRYPPRLLPHAQETTEVEGEDLPLYEIEGQVRALTRRLAVGIYAPADDPDATVRVPTQDVTPVGGFTNPETVVVDGEEQDLWEVPLPDGGTAQMVQVDATELGEFVLPEQPSDTVLANIRTATEVDSITLQPDNYATVIEQQHLDRSLTNTALVTLLVVGGTVVTSILGGYAFARIRFPGRDALFLLYIGSIMVPFVILIIPLYQLMVGLGWVDSLGALVWPFLFNAYGTFLMRQFFVSIPKELEEAAVVDGASRWTILWRIFVPLSYPAIATLSTFMFLYAWNSFVWPFIVINAGNTENHVLTLSLQQLGGRAADAPNLIFAGVVIAIMVPVTVFVLAQRYFVENVAASGIK